MHSSLVETQNFASPVLPMPTCACCNTLASNAPLPRETQNLASLHAAALIMHAYYSPHPPCVLIRLPRYGGENTCAIMTFRDIL